MSDAPEVGVLLWDEVCTTLGKLIQEKTGRELMIRLKRVEMSAEDMTRVWLEIEMSKEMAMNSLGLLIRLPDRPKEVSE